MQSYKHGEGAPELGAQIAKAAGASSPAPGHCRAAADAGRRRGGRRMCTRKCRPAARRWSACR